MAGIPADNIMNGIADIAIKTVLTVQPSLAHIYRSCQADDYENSMVFEVLGFDIMLNSKGKPFLLEVNSYPSFHTSPGLDYKLKKNLISDTLRLLNMSVERKEAYIKKHTEEFQKRMLTGKQSKYTAEERLNHAKNHEYEWN